MSNAAVLPPPLADAEILPFDLPLYGVVGGIFGVRLAAFLVTGAADGRAGVEDRAAGVHPAQAAIR